MAPPRRTGEVGSTTAGGPGSDDLTVLARLSHLIERQALELVGDDLGAGSPGNPAERERAEDVLRHAAGGDRTLLALALSYLLRSGELQPLDHRFGAAASLVAGALGRGHHAGLGKPSAR